MLLNLLPKEKSTLNEIETKIKQTLPNNISKSQFNKFYRTFTFSKFELQKRS